LRKRKGHPVENNGDDDGYLEGDDDDWFGDSPAQPALHVVPPPIPHIPIAASSPLQTNNVLVEDPISDVDFFLPPEMLKVFADIGKPLPGPKKRPRDDDADLSESAKRARTSESVDDISGHGLGDSVVVLGSNFDELPTDSHGNPTAVRAVVIKIEGEESRAPSNPSLNLAAPNANVYSSNFDSNFVASEEGQDVARPSDQRQSAAEEASDVDMLF